MAKPNQTLTIVVSNRIKCLFFQQSFVMVLEVTDKWCRLENSCVRAESSYKQCILVSVYNCTCAMTKTSSDNSSFSACNPFKHFYLPCIAIFVVKKWLLESRPQSRCLTLGSWAGFYVILYPKNGAVLSEFTDCYQDHTRNININKSEDVITYFRSFSWGY